MKFSDIENGNMSVSTEPHLFLNYFDWIVQTPWPLFFSSVLTPSVGTVLAVVIAAFVCISAVCTFRKFKSKVVDTVAAKMMGTRPRFRKRDKVMFYGRKMLRKVQLLSGQASGRPRIKKRQIVLRLAKKILRLRREQPLTLKVMEPSQAFLEEAISEQSEQRLPPDVMYMLKSIRVFGSFEKPLFLELCKHIEALHVSAGSMLFSIGEPDNSIYVVQNGKLVVYVTEMDGSELILKEAGPGENITSLLSVMDVLTGRISPYKTVSARALEDCIVLRLKVEAFRSLLEKNPESLVRVAQIIMVRLQRVTFTALHNYLGLTNQLIKSSSTSTRRNTVGSPKTSPSRSVSRRASQLSHIKPNEMKQHEATQTEVDAALYPKEHNAVSAEECCNDTSAVYHINATNNAKQFVSNYEADIQESKKTRKRKASFYFPPEQGPVQNEEDLHMLAVKGFVQQLGLDDETFVRDYVTVKELPANTYIIREETVEDVALLYVIAGALNVSQKTVDKKEESYLFVVHSGEIMGALAVLSGEPSLFTVRTRHFSQVGILSKKNTYEILRQKPLAVLHLAQSVIKRLSPFVRQIDFALDWINVESGRAIYRQDDISDCTYILLSGRLRSVLNRSDGKKELVGEYGRGDLVGIVEVLTATRRSTTVMAVRYNLYLYEIW
ncbi:patatin-like phospholipase domain-containing protein 7 [Stegodyphus dumicola]|uniref:patatin-like phospholipase domain-containing protein 7 n=1 Tax=Stegodyphus dumicola TaxID=202533 RepID=UPI0015ADBA2C|nr:patatin-like phospholipase domain-containing protein 7 [Stegodyphus dumicola]